ncbi:hypothetical protein EYF80_015876 [Liparis tanakae]|uniref:Uncharacterized protein n=1 Tax=Liparis tanakae TaxID=230148 RepID=A0A4Z2I726_9TELE|nr:hypothetical protein EYF80_015876 [Liparis tanakae]
MHREEPLEDTANGVPAETTTLELFTEPHQLIAESQSMSFPSAQRGVNVVREAAPLHCDAAPPLRSLPGVEPRQQRSESESESGCRSRAVRTLVNTVAVMDFIGGALEALCVLGSTWLAPHSKHHQNYKKQNLEPRRHRPFLETLHSGVRVVTSESNMRDYAPFID